MLRQKKQKPAKKLIPKRLLERIPVAGLYNFLYADSKLEKKIWAIVLIVAAAITLHLFVPSVIQFTKFQTVIEVKHLSERAPFPPLYTCAGVSLNSSYFHAILDPTLKQLKEDQRIRLWSRRYNLSIAQLLDQTAYYLTYSPHFEPFFYENMVHVYNEIIDKVVSILGPRWPGYKAFYEGGTYACNQMLSDCRFNNKEFDCCPDALATTSNAPATCYKLNVTGATINESLNHHAAKIPQLEFQSTIDTNQIFPHFVDGVGLYIHVGSHQITLFDPLYHVAVGTVGFVKIKAKRRQLQTGCIDQFNFNQEKHKNAHQNLQGYFESMATSGQYNINKCLFATFLEEIDVNCGCVVHYDTMQPNDTTICTAAHMYSCIHAGFQVMDDDTTSQGAANNGPGPSNGQDSKIVQGSDLFISLKDRAKECLPLCDSWQYEAHITMSPLVGSKSNTSTVIYNRVVVSFDEEYRIERDVLKIDLISFFATIGDNLSVFLGISMLSLVQGIFWSIAAFLLRRKLRRVAPMQAKPSASCVVKA